MKKVLGDAKARKQVLALREGFTKRRAEQQGRAELRERIARTQRNLTNAMDRDKLRGAQAVTARLKG